MRNPVLAHQHAVRVSHRLREAGCRLVLPNDDERRGQPLNRAIGDTHEVVVVEEIVLLVVEFTECRCDLSLSMTSTVAIEPSAALRTNAKSMIRTVPPWPCAQGGRDLAVKCVAAEADDRNVDRPYRIRIHSERHSGSFRAFTACLRFVSSILPWQRVPP